MIRFMVGMMMVVWAMHGWAENAPQNPALKSTAPVILDTPESLQKPANLLDVVGDLFGGMAGDNEPVRQPILTNAIGQKITNGKPRGTVAKGKHTGLDLPRFVSLRKRANLRSGPGKRYPILWVLTTIDQPLEIIAEYNDWRQLTDMTGAKGWVWAPLLKSNRRLSVITDEAPLYADKSHTAPVVARLGKSIVLKPRSCDLMWCHVTAIHPTKMQVGWVRRAHTWGLYENEQP